jgi:hypothetical protein
MLKLELKKVTHIDQFSPYCVILGLGDWMVKLYFALNLLSGDLNFGFLVFISLSATCIPSLLDLLGGRVETPFYIEIIVSMTTFFASN